MIKYLSLEEYGDYTFHTLSEIESVLNEHECSTDITKANWLKHNGYMKYSICDDMLQTVQYYPFIRKVFNSNIEPIRYFSDYIANESLNQPQLSINVNVSYENICSSEHYIDSVIFTVEKKNGLYTCVLHVVYNSVYTDEDNVELIRTSIFPQACISAVLIQFMTSNHHSKSIVWDTITKYA